jgi:hypothetical protein
MEILFVLKSDAKGEKSLIGELVKTVEGYTISHNIYFSA